jgi:FkbM family methyltransferase
MVLYNEKCEIVNQKIDTVGPWVWVKEDNELWNIISYEWQHLKELWGKHVKKYNVCIQAGGAFGMYPRLLADTFKTVYTFEPNPLSFYCLVNNCQSPNIIKINMGLGEAPGTALIKTAGLSNPGEARIKDNGDTRIQLTTIDNLSLEACDFIQLDVETYELNALKGAAETTRKYNPVISVENGNEEILEFLNTLAPYKHVGSFGIGSDRSDDVYKVV